MHISKEFQVEAKKGERFEEWSGGSGDYGTKVTTTNIIGEVIGEKIMLGAKSRSGTVVARDSTFFAVFEKSTFASVLRGSASNCLVFTPIEVVNVLQKNPQDRMETKLHYLADFLKVGRCLSCFEL